jgi:hypothetical protein
LLVSAVKLKSKNKEMTMNYFTPADLKQIEATYNYTARAGLGFGITENNEMVFITARDVERLNLDVGDAIRVWATDNYASPHTAHYPSRWRAVRVEVVARVGDSVRTMPNTALVYAPPVYTPPPAPVAEQPAPRDFSALVSEWDEDDDTPAPVVVPAPVASPAPAPAPHTTDFVGLLDTLMKEDRPWTAKKLADTLATMSTPLSALPDLTQKVINRLASLHRNGDVARLKICVRADQKASSAVYYAKNVDVFYSYLDTPLADEE